MWQVKRSKFPRVKSHDVVAEVAWTTTEPNCTVAAITPALFLCLFELRNAKMPMATRKPKFLFLCPARNLPDKANFHRSPVAIKKTILGCNGPTYGTVGVAPRAHQTVWYIRILASRRPDQRRCGYLLLRSQFAGFRTPLVWTRPS